MSPLERCPGGDSDETGAAGLGCVQAGIWQRTWGQLQEGGFVQGQVGLGLCDRLCFQAGKGDGLGRGFPVGSRHLLLREMERAGNGGEMEQKMYVKNRIKQEHPQRRGFVSTSSASLGPLKQKGADSHEQLHAMKEKTIEKRTCPKLCN